MKDEDVEKLMIETRPPGEWALGQKYMDDPMKALLHDHLFAVRWACNMLGITEPQETHGPFLEAVAKAVLLTRAVASI